MYKLKIVIPALNEEKTIIKTLESLSYQNYSIFDAIRICIIDDGSKDNTSIKAKEVFKKLFSKQIDFEIIKHDKPLGISRSQNEGIFDYENYDFILLCQADILINEKDGIIKLVDNLVKNNLFATFPYVIHLEDLWQSYPFWQKVLLDRQINRRSESKIAKLALLSKECISKVGLFDENITGTEDRDYYQRIILKAKLEVTDIDVIHIHSAAQSFSWRKLVYKEGQQAEGSACMIRKYGFIGDIKDSLLILFRPLIAVMNLIPIINFISIPLTLLFFYFYSKKTISYCITKKFDAQLLLLLPVLAYSLYISLFVFINSFITGRVNYFRNK